MFMDWKTSILVKWEKLLKLIHRFNAISIRIPAISLWKLTK